MGSWTSSASTTADSRPNPRPENLTFLVLKDGRGRLVTDYWFEAGERVRFVSIDGTSGVLPIAVLDLGRTVKLNRERGVEFVIQAKDADRSPGLDSDLLPSSGRLE